MGLFKYLTTSEILYKKQFEFRKGHSTEHAIIQLIDQINNSFENHFTLCIFIDLLKAFDTVDHKYSDEMLPNFELIIARLLILEITQLSLNSRICFTLFFQDIFSYSKIEYTKLLY